MTIYKGSLKQISESREILLREEDFAYMLPCEQLRSVISNFTITFPDKSTISDAYTIMPHGSVTLVFFHYKGELHSFLFGPAMKPQKVGDLANKCDDIFIIEFQPAGFFPFTKMNQKELADQIIPLSVVDYALDQMLRNIFRTSLSVDELLLAFEKELLLNIRYQYPEELTLTMNAIIQKQGILTAVEISNQAFYSSRHLNRLFNLYLGTSMKSFSRLVRINNAIQLLNERTNTLAFIGEKLGYYDVSHFVKDLKIVCGISPQEYRVKMSDFYSEIAKF